jgi:hypothetical protein
MDYEGMWHDVAQMEDRALNELAREYETGDYLLALHNFEHDCFSFLQTIDDRLFHKSMANG